MSMPETVLHYVHSLPSFMVFGIITLEHHPVRVTQALKMAVCELTQGSHPAPAAFLNKHFLFQRYDEEKLV